jgi:hypothetical protein
MIEFEQVLSFVFFEDLDVLQVVIVIFEDGLFVVASRENMINEFFGCDSCCSRHW